MPDLIEIARQVGAPLLATNDAHYTRRDEAANHDVLLCIQTGSNKDDANRLRFEGEDFYLKSAAEMRSIFPEDQYPGACDNTLLIAERAKVELEFGRILLPQFAVPEGHTERSYLEHLVFTGAQQRYGDPLPEVVRDRIAAELAVIVDMGFPAYFLIVWDLISYARERKIRVGPGRGSSAGSIVAYCLRITDLDPIEHGMIFERFLNPGRLQLPDIDMDFDERYRADVIRYAAEKYGSDHVAQIVTFSTIKGKQALRDAARVLGHPYSVGDRLAKAMPPAILGQGGDARAVPRPASPDADSELKGWYSNAADLRELYPSDAVLKEVADVARSLEGLRRQDSIHAAAVVISPHPLTEHVPIQRKGEDAEIVTQYEMYGIEALGLLKMDFLGLRNLSIIERTLELIKEGRGRRRRHRRHHAGRSGRLRPDPLGADDRGLPARRERIAVVDPRPAADRFEDVIALVALYRPGPLGQNMHTAYADRKNGRAKVEFPHPATESILARSYGIIVYQEQVMQIAQAVAGYTMAEAEDLRRAMGKKVKAAMHAQREKFVAGCVAQGYTPEVGANLFDTIEPFAGYGFNRSHAACYGYIAYQTAWLKAHYPAEYMAAMLTATKRDKERTAVYLDECRSMGVEVMVPDVNESQMDFSVHEGKIRFGLSAIRNVGEGVVEKIIDSRTGRRSLPRLPRLRRSGRPAGPQQAHGRISHQGGRLRRGGSSPQGALPAVRRPPRGDPRASPQRGHGSVLAVRGRRHRRRAGGYGNRRRGVGPEDEARLRAGDARALRFRSSAARLWAPTLKSLGQPISGLVEHQDRGQRHRGRPGGLHHPPLHQEGRADALLPTRGPGGLGRGGGVPGCSQRIRLAGHGRLGIVVKGHLDHRGDEVKVIAREITELKARADLEVRLEVPARRLSTDLVAKLKDILSHHPGSAPVFLHMVSDDKHKVLKLADSH